MVRDLWLQGGTVGPVTKGRLLGVLVVLVLVAAGCGNSGAPTSYTDNAAEYCPGDGELCEPNVGQAERNFRDGCWESGQDNVEERIQRDLASVCKCVFDQVRVELDFEEFKDIDDDMRGDINAHRDNDVIGSIVRQCILDITGV